MSVSKSIQPVSLYDKVTGSSLKVTQDGSDYLLELISKVKNSSGTLINPATEDTLSTIDSVLDSIKDTDGIKKITDQLPAGTNEIGYVAQGTKASGSDGWPTVLYDSSGNAVTVTSEGGAYRLETLSKVRDSSGTIINPAEDESLQAIVDSGNSSTSQLGNGGTFVGTGVDCLSYAAIAVTIHSDQDSSIDGMKFQFSIDNTNWDDSYSWTLDASTSTTRRFQFPVCARYFRLNYTNGTSSTTEFRCQTILQRQNILTSIHRLKDVAHDDRSAQIVKSAIIAQREGIEVKNFYPIQADVSGNLKVTTIGTDVPSDPDDLILDFPKNGGSETLLVDGSSTPVNFEIGPTITDEVWSIRELLMTFTADDFVFDGVSFGPITSLTNGVSINIVKNSVVKEIFVIKQNEDFLRLPGRTPLVNNTGPKDVLGAAIAFQGLVLNQSTSDVVRVIVRDDLTSVKLKYFTATLFAVKVE